MNRWIVLGAVAAITLGTAQMALAGHKPAEGRIAGRVLVCYGPGHCAQRSFHVRAVNAAGRTVASFTTTNPHNDYSLRVAPGSYKLVAKSTGFNCKASATAVAHKTTRQNITCPVP